MRALYLGTTLIAGLFLSGEASASDNCPRLESSSLVILIPDGGCDADATEILAQTSGVTLIRGLGYPSAIHTAAIAADPRARWRLHPRAFRSGPSVIVINIDQRRH